VTLRRDLHQQNRQSWNLATQAHNSHKGDQARFLREGGSTLFPEELELLGEVRGARIVHLQCNAGQDTISLASLGADVTGVDISDEAIGFAQRLSKDSGIGATFVRSDVYDWLDVASAAAERFDIAFCSYGTLIWLSDIERWAKGVAGLLKPGGFFAIVEFHPVAQMFNERMQLDWPYFSGDPVSDGHGVGDYVAFAGEGLVPWGFEEGVQEFENLEAAVEFTRGVSEIVTALLGAGLVLEVFREYPYSNGAKRYENAEVDTARRYYTPPGVPHIPQMYALRMRKPM
jgi:SAM-dependent methyltransferase